MVDNVDSLKAYTFKRGLNANFSVMFEVNILINLIGKYFTQLVISGTETPSYHYSFFVPGFFFISFFIQQVINPVFRILPKWDDFFFFFLAVSVSVLNTNLMSQ